MAIKACQHGHRVAFATAQQWVDRLDAAQHRNALDDELRRLERYGLIVVDEIGYLPLERQAANLLFALVARRYERGSIILTSNRGFEAWGDILGDAMVAAALIDRLIHHAHMVTLKGKSYRLRERGTAPLPTAAPSRQNSQTSRPELRRLRRLRATRWSTFQIPKPVHFSRPVDIRVMRCCMGGLPSTGLSGVIGARARTSPPPRGVVARAFGRAGRLPLHRVNNVLAGSV